MRLAACFTIFNGLELLQSAIANVFDLVDDVVLCYQTTSNKGNACDVVERFVIDNYSWKPKIHIIKFEPDLALNTKENERRKHQMMLEFARARGCSHFYLSATDHFYSKKEFIFAKQLVERHDLCVTFSKMFTYYKHPTWQITPPEDYFMPFIMKLNAETKIQAVRTYPVRVDPSVQVTPVGSYYVFTEDELMMHHFSMVRENIRGKFKNAAASIRWQPGAAEMFADEFENYDIEKNIGVKYFSGRKIKIVVNHFNIPHFTDII